MRKKSEETLCSQGAVPTKLPMHSSIAEIHAALPHGVSPLGGLRPVVEGTQALAESIRPQHDLDGGAPVLGVHVHAFHPFAQLGAYGDFRAIRGTRPSSPRIASSTLARALAPPEPRREIGLTRDGSTNCCSKRSHRYSRRDDGWNAASPPACQISTPSFPIERSMS